MSLWMQQNTHSKSDLKPDIFQSEHFFKICEEKALDYLTSPPSIVSHQNPCFDSTPQKRSSSVKKTFWSYGQNIVNRSRRTGQRFFLKTKISIFNLAPMPGNYHHINLFINSCKYIPLERSKSKI